jgi:hypothetical protein
VAADYQVRSYPLDLRIEGVQPFTWESSGARSLLSLGSFSLQRGLSRGLRFGATYTLARSMDNASSLGAGGAVVAQNDQDLEAEYALSNFDQRHQFSANVMWELPFGVGRKWLSNGGAPRAEPSDLLDAGRNPSANRRGLPAAHGHRNRPVPVAR